MSDWLLLDTNIVSFLLKKDTRAKQFKPILKDKLLALSFMSEAELYRWSIERNWGEKKCKLLEKALKRYVVLPYDRQLGQAWARVMATCSQKGKTMAPADAWIAASALRHELRLLTHNVKHFQNAQELCGVRLVTNLQTDEFRS